MSEKFEKIIKNDPNFLPLIDSFITVSLKNTNITNDLLSNIILAVSEGASNAMVHGNKLDPSKNVIISINIFDNRLEFRIKDQGGGFNPELVPDPTAPDSILKDSGRGIHIIRAFVDDIKYTFSKDGTELLLVINLNR